MVISLLLPLKFAIRTWFCNCPQYLCLFRIFFECIPSIHDPRKMLVSPKSTSLLSTFHNGSILCGKTVVHVPGTSRHHVQRERNSKKDHMSNREWRDESEAYCEIHERRSKWKELDRNHYTVKIRERVYRKRLGRTSYNVQEHKWRSCAVVKCNTHSMVKNTANSKFEFLLKQKIRPDDWSCRRNGDATSSSRIGSWSDSHEPCWQSTCKSMGIQERDLEEWNMWCWGYMYVQDVVEKKLTNLAYISTKQNKADLTTKCHTSEAHKRGCATEVNIPVTQIVEEITEVNIPVTQIVEEIADRDYSCYTDCGRDHRGEYSSTTECGRDRRGEQILEWVMEYSESLLWGNQSVSRMSLCETGQLIRFCVDRVLCLSRVQIDARARFVFSFS